MHDGPLLGCRGPLRSRGAYFGNQGSFHAVKTHVVHDGPLLGDRTLLYTIPSGADEVKQAKPGATVE